MAFNEGIMLRDPNGLPYGIKQIQNKPRISATPYLYDIAEGNLSNHFAIRRYGHNPNLDTSLETVSDISTLRAELTYAQQLWIRSSSAADAAAGTGATAVTLSALDANYACNEELITLNGTTAVGTAYTTYWDALTVEVATVGSDGTNQGDIGVIATDPAETTLIQASALLGLSHSSCFWVPAGYTFYITDLTVSEATNKGVEFYFYYKEPTGGWKSQLTYLTLGSSVVHTLSIPLVYTEKTKLQWRARAIQAGADVAAGYAGWYES